MADFIHRRSHPIICQLEARVIEGGIFSCVGEGGDGGAVRIPWLRMLGMRVRHGLRGCRR